MEGKMETAHVLYEIILHLFKTYILSIQPCTHVDILNCAFKNLHSVHVLYIHVRLVKFIMIRSSRLRTLRTGARPNLLFVWTLLLVS